jgi:Na+:H+ antiporter, NhaA family
MKRYARIILTPLFKEFYESEKAGGLILIFCTIVSLFIANSLFQIDYLNFWHTQFADHTLVHWINDGLMTIFFLLIGLELEREIYIGELSSVKKALLPTLGALGGMLVPAGIYLYINMGTISQSGAGIPMATDIAFALGILSLLGNRVPPSLKLFLTALAVIDDLGAIIVIAIFYTSTIVWTNLIIVAAIMSFLFLLNRMKVFNLIPYFIGGIIMWYLMLHSGIHATIIGVLLAFVIPFGNGETKSSSYQLQHYLHKPVAFIILPLFALANTAIIINGDFLSIVEHPYSIGIMSGLAIGKPIGITLVCFIGVTLGLCELPEDLNWKHIFGAGILGGIGFTMSIFICLLSFNDEAMINNAKFIVLVSSLISGIVGFFFLRLILKKTEEIN